MNGWQTNVSLAVDNDRFRKLWVPPDINLNLVSDADAIDVGYHQNCHED